MGFIAEQLRAEIEEMKARHAETDRRVQVSLNRLNDTIAKIQRINREIDNI